MLAHVRRYHEKLPTAVDVNTPIPEQPLVTLHFDGSCAPNPGPMGIGYVIKSESGSTLVRVGAQVGQGTNNEAEYQALLAGLRHALKLGYWSIQVRSDSQLLVNQVTGKWGANKHRLKRLVAEVHNLMRLFNRFEIKHVYREENREADELSHQLVFEEPESAPPPKINGQRQSLHDWQAAAIRVWHLRHHPGVQTLSRIFGITPNRVDEIIAGRKYRMADFSGYEPAGLIEPPPALSPETVEEHVEQFDAESWNESDREHT